MTSRNDHDSTHGRAVGIAAGLTMAVGGAVTALMLTAGPSVAGWMDAGSTETESPAATEVQPATVAPSVYVVDGNGNLIAQDGSGTASSEEVDIDESDGYVEHDDYDEYDEYEDHEDHDHDEYEEYDEHEDHEYEDDEYEDDEDEYEDDDD